MAITRQEGHTSVTNTKRATALILAIAIFGDATTVFAQAPVAQPPAASPVAAALAPATVTDANTVRILVGRSAIVDVGTPIARVSLTSNDIADAMVTTPSQLLVNGKVPGTISMFVWDRGGTLRRYEVSVGRDLSQLNAQVHELFPTERIEVQNNGKNVVLAGIVSSKEIGEKAVSVAAGYVEKKDDVVNLLQVSPAQGNQVLLRVRFAEVSRSALTELGLSLAANGYKDGRWYGRSTTQQFAAPQWDEDGKFVFSDFLNLFLFDTKNQLAGVLKALQNRGLFQSLAEPNLVAESGKEASFLAGGEIPVPVAQGSGTNIGISILWKEFGVRLNFTPEVNGNRIHLKVKPEVSTLDYTNAVTLDGFRIPALTTRRTETQLELQDGQTFAIAGLMNNQMTSTLQKIPGIGDIPVLGNLFRSKAAKKDLTELVVMITPEILRQSSPGVTPALPRMPERFLDPLPNNKTREMPPPAFSAPPSSDASPIQTVKPSPARNAGSKATPANAAAAVSSLTPSAPKVVSAPAAARPSPAPIPVTPPPATTFVATPAPASTETPVSPSITAMPAPEAPAPFVPAPSAPMPSFEPAVPASTFVPAPKTSSVSPARPKPATKEESELLERAMREQQAREDANNRAKAEEAKKRQAEAQKAAQEQEKKDIVAAKRQAEVDRKRAEVDAKRAEIEAKRAAEASRKQAEAAKKQAAIDAEQAKAMDAVAANLRAAQKAYEAEIARQHASAADSSR
jgi:pilus assembly protein CpaC